jgi:archaellum biogenesis ATPase FlaH
MNRFIIILVILFTAVGYGQNGNREKIKSLKVAFITEQLALTSKEAQQFWPVYNEFEEKRQSLRQKERTQIRSKIQDAMALSEAQAITLLEQLTDFKMEEEKLNLSYLKEIKKVMSAKKTLLLIRSEEDFKRQLIKQYRQNNRPRQ